MLAARVIPCLLIEDGRLVKSVKFRNAKYIGDPINAVRIFNDKEVDELLFLDIGATRERREPDFALIADIASEAFMPFGYGGGVTTIEQVKRLFAIGVEKVVINTAAAHTPGLISEAASVAGSASIVASVDVRLTWRGKYEVCVAGGTRKVSSDPVTYARSLEARGAGEILLTAIHRDGTMQGYDLPLVEKVAAGVGVPVVAAGGAGDWSDFRAAVRHGASGVAAGSLFVYQGKHKAVLITYPQYAELQRLFDEDSLVS